jgi:hypothetical protein
MARKRLYVRDVQAQVVALEAELRVAYVSLDATKHMLLDVIRRVDQAEACLIEIAHPAPRPSLLRRFLSFFKQ